MAMDIEEQVAQELQKSRYFAIQLRKSSDNEQLNILTYKDVGYYQQVREI